MIKIVNKTLEDCYIESSKRLGLPIDSIKVTIVQKGLKGIFGLFKRDFVVIAEAKSYLDINIGDSDDGYGCSDPALDEVEDEVDNSEVIIEIKDKLEELFSTLDFSLYVLEINYNKNIKTVYINLSGDSLALMIGHKGYRYKAIYNLLSTWLKLKYNLLLKLEIAEFFKKQDVFLSKYIDDISYDIDLNSYYETESFDEVSIIVLENLLKDRFFDKNIVIKNSKDSGKQYIILKDKR